MLGLDAVREPDTDNRMWGHRIRAALREACKQEAAFPEEAFEVLLSAAVNDPGPSFNRWFVEAALNAFGRGRVRSLLTGYLREGTDAQRAGAARAWYWTALRLDHPGIRVAGHTEDGAEPDDASVGVREWHQAALREFVDNEDLDVRRCILPGLPLYPSAYPAPLHHLVDEAIAIARSHPDEICGTGSSTRSATDTGGGRRTGRSGRFPVYARRRRGQAAVYGADVRLGYRLPSLGVRVPLRRIGPLFSLHTGSPQRSSVHPWRRASAHRRRPSRRVTKAARWSSRPRSRWASLRCPSARADASWASPSAGGVQCVVEGVGLDLLRRPGGRQLLVDRGQVGAPLGQHPAPAGDGRLGLGDQLGDRRRAEEDGETPEGTEGAVRVVGGLGDLGAELGGAVDLLGELELDTEDGLRVEPAGGVDRPQDGVDSNCFSGGVPPRDFPLDVEVGREDVQHAVGHLPLASVDACRWCHEVPVPHPSKGARHH
ncbi:hypothetical protein [Kitasatospora sp. NPDC088346]|uniref:hypothetical protein n=1 Tax=Kitasatospora sp. NPDC088346 TaxID=3364073 RepID=UPI003807ABAE